MAAQASGESATSPVLCYLQKCHALCVKIKLLSLLQKSRIQTTLRLRELTAAELLLFRIDGCQVLWGFLVFVLFFY